jgi:hypothetical protein
VNIGRKEIEGVKERKKKTRRKGIQQIESQKNERGAEHTA